MASFAHACGPPGRADTSLHQDPPHGPLLGLGEGGPQFDRKGSIDEMRNGQEGYRLRTHGGRVPIQWMVSTHASKTARTPVGEMLKF